MTRATKRRGGQGLVEPGLSEQKVVAAARRIIHTDGVGGLSMRRLSDELGVALGATYYYVASRQELLHLVATNIFSYLEFPDDTEGDWAEQVRIAITNFARLIHAYPGMAGELLRESPIVPVELVVFLRARLAQGGLAPEAIDEAVLTLFFFLGGLLLAGTPWTNTRDPDGPSVQHYFDAGLGIVLRGIATL